MDNPNFLALNYFAKVPVAASVFFGKAIQLYIRNKKTVPDVEGTLISVAELHWTMPMLCGCALVGLLAGTVGGLLGLGGGFILGPVFLEMGVPPEVSMLRTY